MNHTLQKVPTKAQVRMARTASRFDPMQALRGETGWMAGMFVA
jgi:hypothetical protein